MYDSSPSVPANLLLRSLPAEEVERVRPLLEPIDLAHGLILAYPDEPISYVYFPEDAMISVVAYTETGQGAEVSVIGPEGAAGLAVVMGARSMPYESMVQIPGAGFRMSTEDMKREFEYSRDLRSVLLAFMHKLHMQVSQTVLYNRLHSVEQRLSKWLLMCYDRNGTGSVRVTQEFLGIMLGSSRTSVTLTAIELQNNGLISYERGNITVRDKASLEDFACGCYRQIVEAYQGRK